MTTIVILVMTLLEQISGDLGCEGTCYSGRLFPESQDIFQGKHLKGFSYKNITTDNPRKCYSICSQDCRCKACQMKDARCELLDEDKTSKPDNFVAESGYVYYDLKQIMYQGVRVLFQNLFVFFSLVDENNPDSGEIFLSYYLQKNCSTTRPARVVKGDSFGLNSFGI